MLEDSFDQFSELISELKRTPGTPLNESDTRLKIVDRVITEVLGWDRSRIHTEPPSDGGFIDYALRDANDRTQLIIEAKRQGTLRPNTADQSTAMRRLSGQVLEPLKEAIDQALRYSSSQGCPISCVTDGTTWLVFRSARTDGVPIKSGKGFLFPSIFGKQFDFSSFFDLLSAHSVDERIHLARLNELDDVKVLKSEQHFQASEPQLATMLPRSDIGQEAEALFRHFFIEMSDENNKEMLRECFVETKESINAENDLKRITEQLLNSISPLDSGSGDALASEIRRAIETQNSESVLIVGSKGSGKSTFVERFFEFKLPPDIRSQCAVCYIGMEKYEGGEDGISRWLAETVRANLEKALFSDAHPTYDQLRGVFYSEYQRLRQGPWKPIYDNDKNVFRTKFGDHIESRRENNPFEYVKLLLTRCSSNDRKLPVIIFDNTDQHGHNIQDSVYQFSHSLSTESPVFCIVPITDRSIWSLSKADALQSYNSKSFYLPVPEAKQVIAKRVEFLRKKVRSEAEFHQYFSRQGFRVVSDVSNLIDAIEQIFVRTDFVTGTIGRLTNFEIRRMLKLAQRIFLSPEIKIDEFAKSWAGGAPVTSNRYRIDRALIKGEYDRFSEEENSFVLNLLKTDPRFPSSNLLCYYILESLKSREASLDNKHSLDVYWKISEILRYFESCGSSEESTLNALRRMFERRLIEEVDPNTKTLAIEHSVRIMDAGKAHIDMMLNSDVYIEQMALCTGISDASLVKKFRDCISKANSKSFKEIHSLFIGYVKTEDAAKITFPRHPSYSHMQTARHRFFEAHRPCSEASDKPAAE